MARCGDWFSRSILVLLAIPDSPVEPRFDDSSEGEIRCAVGANLS